MMLDIGSNDFLDIFSQFVGSCYPTPVLRDTAGYGLTPNYLLGIHASISRHLRNDHSN